MFGGSGNDTLSGTVAMNGDNGNDSISVHQIRFELSLVPGEAHGNAGNDTIFGSAFSMALFGDDGDDELNGRYYWGGPTSGIMVGGDGNDQIQYETHGDGTDRVRIYGGAGNDTLEGPWVRGDEGEDLLLGTKFNDTLLGRS